MQDKPPQIVQGRQDLHEESAQQWNLNLIFQRFQSGGNRINLPNASDPITLSFRMVCKESTKRKSLS